ncbi:hypothetical protein D3C87_1717860 [compost metagenome]
MASFTEVWSFQSTNIAFGLVSNPGKSANGTPCWLTATGVEPVVSTAIALIPAATAAPPAF